MTIELKPETEALIQGDIRQDGPYPSAQAYVEHAIRLLHDQESWLVSNKALIKAQLEEGYAASLRGDLAGEDQVRADMSAKKLAWTSQGK